MPAKNDGGGPEIGRAILSQVVAELIVAGLRNLPSIPSYIYSVSVFGSPNHHILHGLALSFALTLALLSPIVGHRSFAGTPGINPAAQRQYLRRYWTSISFWFILLAALGTLLSYYFETELVFL